VTDDSGEAKPLLQNRYRVLGLLGRGAQADTLWAEDTQSGAQVAIKRFQVRGAKSWKDVELAEREASVLARLKHKNLPKYLDHFEEDGSLFLVMEKIEGETLAELRAKGRLDQALVRRFLSDLADTLGYLHGLSPPIVHRDIKPQNVILRPDGGFSLVDFGSVREKLRPQGGSTVVGTFGYMAPEQFQGRASPASDVFGAGATALACLTGTDPEDLPHRGLGIDVAAALGGHVEPNLVELLSRLLEPDPDKRPRSLAEALSASSRARSRASSAPYPVPPGFDAMFSAQALRGLSRKQLRRIEKRKRREARRLRRVERRAQRLHGATNRIALLPGWFWILVVLGVVLFALRIVTSGVLRIAVPILVSVLAIVFGPAMHRLARRSGRAADHIDDALGRALDHVRGVPPPEVEPPRRMRVEDGEVLDDDELEHEAPHQDARSRASR
jgi:tRNA A-37 threonylcarbamoyl transferase component Bud32